MDKSKELLTRQLEVEIEKLATMEDGSEEKQKTIDGISQMYRLKLEEDKRELELASKDVEFEIQEKHKLIDTVLDGVKVAVSVVGGVVVPIIFMRKGFKFEETGTYTSQTFKNLFGKFRLK